MAEKDLTLQQENEKLTARLKKAVEVFNEQKATIARQTEEIAALKTKASEAEKKDSEFFDQVNEIEKLKEDLAKTKKEKEKLEADLDAQKNLTKQMGNTLNKAREVIEKQISSLKQDLIDIGLVVINEENA